MIKAIIDLWWLWLILGIWLPAILIVGIVTLVIKLLSLFDTSELTWEGIKGHPLSEAEKKRRVEGWKELLNNIKQYVKGIFRI